MTLLIAAVQAVNADRVFEIGTFLGSTTLNLALNIPVNGTVITLDLDHAAAGTANQHPSDALLTDIHLGAVALDFQDSPVAKKITTLTGDSTTFDFSPWRNSMDFIFIDGGHDYETVKSDTENAYQLLRSDRESCIAWHDYQNAEYPELSGYLDSLSEGQKLFHVEDSRLCLYFNDPQQRIIPRLV